MRRDLVILLRKGAESAERDARSRWRSDMQPARQLSGERLKAIRLLRGISRRNVILGLPNTACLASAVMRRSPLEASSPQLLANVVDRFERWCIGQSAFVMVRKIMLAVATESLDPIAQLSPI
jgi:hypothetical protein